MKWIEDDCLRRDYSDANKADWSDPNRPPSSSMGLGFVDRVIKGRPFRGDNNHDLIVCHVCQFEMNKSSSKQNEGLRVIG